MITFGVVEDIDDPLRMDRVRVRIYGLHTDNKTLIPTDSLPWAMVEKSTNSASMSGIGEGGHGLLPGTWVTLDFFDEDQQYPLVRGTIAGVPFNTTTQVTGDDQLEFSDSEAVPSNAVRDSQGAPVTDSQGAPVTTDDKPKEATPPGKVDVSKLGSVSAQYESNGNPTTINNYKTGQDSGGASYGCYQFASYLISPSQPARNRTLAQAKNSPLTEYLAASAYSSKFSGLTPATTEFDACWKGISDSAGFKADQHKYIEKKYYQVAAAKLPASITGRGQAVHEAIWSRAVQLGPGKAAQQIAAAAGNATPEVCDSKVVEMIYDDQIKNLQTNFASSSGLWSGLRKRFESEKSQLVAMAKGYEGDKCSGAYTTEEQKKVEYTEDGKKETTVVVTKPVAQPTAKGSRGFQDPAGVYPKRYNEPDTSRLARGVITGTPIEKKRANVVTKLEAGATMVSEPITQYNTKYPHNRVYESESGHVVEYDDTPGYERIHIFHKSGAFIEIHPDGKIVHKTPSSNHTIVADRNDLIVLGSNNRHVEEDENATVGGALNIKVLGDANLQVDGDYNVKVGGTMNIDGQVVVSKDVVASGVSLVSHRHTKVQAGKAMSGPPASGGGGGAVVFPGADAGVDNTKIPSDDNNVIVYDNSPEGHEAQLSAELAVSETMPGHAEDDQEPVKSDDPDPPTDQPTGCDGAFNEPVTAQDMMKKCSDNFTLGHCKMMPTAQLGLTSSQIACNWKKLCTTILEPAYAVHKFSVNSGFRSEAYNKALEAKGYHPSKTSDHMTGCAADIAMPTKEQTIALFKWLKNSGLPFSQLIFETTWVHVAFGGRPHEDAYKIAYSENKGGTIVAGGMAGENLPAYLA
jgi:hypothetical protein